MKVKFTHVAQAGPSAPEELTVEENGRRFYAVGTVFEGLQAWQLVVGGYAEPADQECVQELERRGVKPGKLMRETHERIMQEHEEFRDDLRVSQWEAREENE